MKTLVVFAMMSLAGFALPSGAEASLELGTTTGIGWNLELPRVSLGLGADLHWQKVSEPLFYYADSFGYVVQEGTLIVVEPRLTTRFFLSRNRELQPFVVARVERELPIVIADSGSWTSVKEANNNWIGDLGAGIRSDLNARVSFGGEFVARVSYFSYPGTRTQSFGSTNFLVFLQYHP